MIDEGPRILIVDDNSDDLILAEREIRRGFADCRIVPISTRAEFGRALASGEFDLVITDYRIGWTDGISVLRTVRQRWPEAPVIMFTSTGSEEIAVAAMKAGLNDYVLKSAKPRGRLVSAMRVALEAADQRRALRDAEARYHVLFDSVPTPLYRSTPDGRILGANRAMVDLLGYPDLSTLLATPVLAIYADPEERRRWQCDAERSGVIRGREILFRRLDGEVRRVLLNVSITRDDDGDVSHYEGSIEDVTELRAQEAQLAYAATHDQLTGLPNRRQFEARLAMLLLGDGSEQSADGAILVVDIDNLRLVNETLGHLAGDEVLLMLAEMLRKRLAPGHLLARIHSDDFAVLLGGVSIGEATALAESLCRAVDDHVFDVRGSEFSLGVSIGLVALERDSTPGELLARADAALQKAKDRGQNRVAIYRREEDDAAKFAAENRLIVDLKRALRERRFVLHYQPIVRLADGTVQSYEALLRLRDENGQLVPPGAFLPAAEHFGLMPRLTHWIVDEAVATLRRRPEISLYINLSAHCLNSEPLLESIESHLARGDVKPERLGFELTESALIQDLAAAERWIQRLKSVGCRFALDDFGSGFSSFAHLRNLPFDKIKLDGTIIRGIAEDSTQRHFAQAIQMLAEATNKEVVAEYVENELTVSILRELGVAFGQGFHLGRPAPEPRLKEGPTLQASDRG